MRSYPTAAAVASRSAGMVVLCPWARRNRRSPSTMAISISPWTTATGCPPPTHCRSVANAV